MILLNMVKHRTSKCCRQLWRGVARQGRESPGSLQPRFFLLPKSSLYITYEPQQRQKGQHLLCQCTKLKDQKKKKSPRKWNIHLVWWQKRCSERTAPARGFSLFTSVLRLQKSGLKTTATFLTNKDIQEVEKRNNSLMEVITKLTLLPSLNIRKLKKLTQTHYRKNMQSQTKNCIWKETT